MRISLVITDVKRKSVVFVSDTFKIFSLEEAFSQTKEGLLESVFIVNGTYGKYLRGTPNTSRKDNLDTLSITVADVIAYANRSRHFQSTDAISVYAARYIASLSTFGGPFVETIDGDKVLAVKVKKIITPHAKIIKKVSENFSIDPYLLGAILIDEVVRLAPFEDLRDLFLLHLIGRNISVGIAQIKLETANDLIKRGLYNPNLSDKKLPFSGNMTNKDREYLYQYVTDTTHNLNFAGEFYTLAKNWLK